MKLAVMQPYIFPYIGYFQLINAVDIFVFYDDVNFIKRGWVNRNNILINGKENMFTIPCLNASQNKLINEVEYDKKSPLIVKNLKSIEHAYRKAPFFKDVFPLLQKVFNANAITISDLAVTSIIEVANYLEMTTQFQVSSKRHSNTFGFERADRLIEICKNENVTDYINSFGGQELYNKEYFQERGITLNFIKTNPDIRYSQFTDDFIPWLSIIDVLMFNSVLEINEMLDNFELV